MLGKRRSFHRIKVSSRHLSFVCFQKFFVSVSTDVETKLSSLSLTQDFFGIDPKRWRSTKTENRQLIQISCLLAPLHHFCFVETAYFREHGSHTSGSGLITCGKHAANM